VSVDEAEAEKSRQLELEVAAGIRSKLPAGFTFMGVGSTERGLRGRGMDRLLNDVAAHGARHTVGCRTRTEPPHRHNWSHASARGRAWRCIAG
jgi:hypothetical protein